MIKKILLISIFLVLPALVFAENQFPSFPMAFWGTATINGSPSPVGTVIYAYYGNVLAGQVTTTEIGIYGYNSSAKQKLLVGEGNGTITFGFQSPTINGGVKSLGCADVSYTGFTSGLTVEKNLVFNTTGCGGGGGGGGGGIVLAASPVAGTYNSAQSVTLIADGSLSVHYTINGSTPTCSTGTVYSGVISVGTTQTIKAIACYGENFSDVASFTYTININTGGGGGGGGGGGNPPIIPTTAKTGDANGDNKIDKYDFSLMMSNWGKTGTNSCDFNNDGKVDKYDFALLMSKWGT